MSKKVEKSAPIIVIGVFFMPKKRGSVIGGIPLRIIIWKLLQ